MNRRAILEEHIARYPELADTYRQKLARVAETEQQVANVESVFDLLRSLESYLDGIDSLLRINAAATGQGTKKQCPPLG